MALLYGQISTDNHQDKSCNGRDYSMVAFLNHGAKIKKGADTAPFQKIELKMLIQLFFSSDNFLYLSNLSTGILIE